MEVILRMVFIAFIAISGMVMNHDLTTKAQSLHYLKEDLEVAAHDAALDIVESELASGRIVFDQSKAMTTFRNSFERNSNLSSGDYEIVEMHFLDHSTTATFPHRFEASNVGFSDVITAPTIMAFIETKKNAYYGGSSEETFTQVASYTYQPQEQNLMGVNSMASRGNVSVAMIGNASSQGFHWPVPFTDNVTSNFGMRTHPVTGERKLHAGTDIATPGVFNTPTIPAKSGTVIFAGYIAGYGNVVMISHGNGLETRYAHLNSISVTAGQEVGLGDVLGKIGNTGVGTGPHLHFEVRINGVPYDPMTFY